MTKTIEISEDIYERLGRHAQPFETPAQVIERLLDSIRSSEPTPIEPTVTPSVVSTTATTQPNPRPVYTGKLDINFYPDDLTAFKAKLLQRKAAWILMHYRDGNRDLKHWSASNFKPTSDVLGNLRSGYLRGWRERGLIRADIAIDRDDLDVNGETL